MTTTTPSATMIAQLAAAVAEPDSDARAAALARWDSRETPPESFGRLEQVAAWLCAVQGTCPPSPVDDVHVLVLAGDHGVAAADVSAYPADATAARVRSVAAGESALSALAQQVGATVTVVDVAVDADLSDLGPALRRHRIRRGTGRIDVEDAMTTDDAMAAFAVGRDVADAAVDSGAQLLVPADLAVAGTTPASALVALLTRSEVVEVVGRGSGIDDATWMRKAAAVRDAAYRGRSRLGDPLDLLSAVGGPDLAALAGCMTQAAVRRTPVLVDGLVVAAAALVAQRVAFRAPHWWVAAGRSREPGHAAALDRLGLRPLLDLETSAGGGLEALLAVPLVQAAATLLAEVPQRRQPPTTTSAGLTD